MRTPPERRGAGTMFGRGALTLGQLFGVPIRLHISLLLALPFIAYAVASQFDQTARAAGIPPGELLLSPLGWGLLLAVLLFVGVLLHELAHVIVALRYQGRVRGVTLMLLGGVSEIERPPEGARAELLMAFAGPLCS